MTDFDSFRSDRIGTAAPSSPFPSTAYYVNPENMYDPSTPRGRELMQEVYPTAKLGRNATRSPLLMICIVAFILFVFLS